MCHFAKLSSPLRDLRCELLRQSTRIQRAPIELQKRELRTRCPERRPMGMLPLVHCHDKIFC
jgi:hypothetical protein